MKLFLTLLLLGSSFLNLYAQSSPVYTTANGALDGYDAVAYFTDAKPVKGTTDLVFSWQDADWHFSSRKNLDSFVANPEMYAPQYGGYCAFGCSEGHKAPTAADAWTIVDGKLYLNYNRQVKKEWMKSREEHIRKADTNWMTLKNNK